MIKLKIIGICLLWIACISPVFGQYAPLTSSKKDTVNDLTREQQMQDRLESYVQTLSGRKAYGGRVRVLLMPVVGFNPSQMSYGLMAGVMKRTGGYVMV